MKKLPPKYNATVLPFVLSGLMTFVVSFVTSVINLGFIDIFLKKWLGAWALSWIIAFPTLVILLPMVRKFIANFVEPPK